ncbi:hypothetical protein CVT24_001428 [Panaeolus cyanescens]|uniref:GST N-terminal domain-containing protein n=1 Tax=Panaeolus cyanescens TaxID=181874 RepID=A0A409WIY7_9AGAR|nr:hypothetical protein CVT24_001428 [Panaeolus cyanescens]
MAAEPFAFNIDSLPPDKITLFDIRYDIEPHKSVSPWSWAVKYTLYAKKIPFHIKLVEMVDIPALSKVLGLQPGEGFTAEPMYTLPAIYDPSTKKAIVDSLAINMYLDAQYPESPRVVAEGTKGLIKAFLTAMKNLDYACFPVAIEICLGLTTAKSREHFRSTREKLLGVKIEDITPREPEKVAAAWAGIKKVFDTMDGWYGDNTFIMGTDVPTHADFVVAGRLMLLKEFFREESEEWNRIAGWNDGRWGKLLKYCNDMWVV